MIFEVRAGGHIPNVPLEPVRAGTRDRIGQPFAVVAEGQPRKRDGPVHGKQVGIDEDTRGPVEHRGHIKDRLVLQSAILIEDVVPAFARRRRESLVVPDVFEALANFLTPRNRSQKSLRQIVLGRNPGTRLRRIDILEPTKRVCDLTAVVVVDDIAMRSRRIRALRAKRHRHLPSAETPAPPVPLCMESRRSSHQSRLPLTDGAAGRPAKDLGVTTRWLKHTTALRPLAPALQTASRAMAARNRTRRSTAGRE